MIEKKLFYFLQLIVNKMDVLNQFFLTRYFILFYRLSNQMILINKNESRTNK